MYAENDKKGQLITGGNRLQLTTLSKCDIQFPFQWYVVRIAKLCLAEYASKSCVGESLTAVSYSNSIIIFEIIIGKRTVAARRERCLISQNIVPRATRCVLWMQAYQLPHARRHDFKLPFQHRNSAESDGRDKAYPKYAEH